jgi:6-phosphogluconolactonase
MTLSDPRVQVFERESEIVDAAIRLWTRACENSLRARGRFCAALSGGKTPIPFYRELSGQKPPDSWRRTHLFLADERFGPPDHPESNGRMIGAVLSRPAGVPAENLHLVPLNRETVEESASIYEKSLREFFRLNRGDLPTFDFILLGVGEDGHTASLFPGTSSLEETGKAVTVVKFGAGRRDRVSLTLPVLNRGREVVFLVCGEGKAGIVRKVIAEKDSSLPAARVRPRSGGAIFLIDRPAGKQLSPGFQMGRSFS